jgi:UDP-N-acetylglucosamine 4,6-dehydratase
MGAFVLERWAIQRLRLVAPKLLHLGRYTKRAILVVADLIILSLSLWLAFSLRLGEPFVPGTLELFLLMWAAPPIGVATFFQLGVYRLVTRYIGGQGLMLIPVAIGLSTLFWSLIVLLSGVSGVPRSVIILYPILATASIFGSRRLAVWLLAHAGVELSEQREGGARGVLIYGAGKTGAQLVEALRNSGNYTPIGFVDPSPTLWGMYVAGLKVYRPDRMASMIQRHDVCEVLLAIPSGHRRERQAALHQLESLKVGVRTLPAYEDVASGRVTVSDLRPVEAGDLLGRDPVPPNPELLAHNIKGKAVLVTGAGGSIGSELARQILRQGPRRLVLMDAAEPPLYEIGQEVERLLARQRKDSLGPIGVPELEAVLGSVGDERLVAEILRKHQIDTIYHAAAYKHVPIVEHNPVAGLANNTFGTATMAEAAERAGVERFVLISTDKAVRPTSIMGASKRLAEMILQARAAEGVGRTVFTMVRFGNVLDSSGSVVRKFRQQIEAGGPVTVTHPDIIRYFMSIPEAAELVIQAGAMATGGDVFVLDMGEPVKIDDLARSMIRLMGQEVRDAQHPEGNIAIDYTGLRPGEKLYEELLLGENAKPTEHPRILKSHEPYLPAAELAEALGALRSAMDAGDVAAIRVALMRAAEGYRPEPQDEIPDAAE